MTEHYAESPETPPPHAGGRPSKYDPKYCDELIAFFDIEPSYQSEVTITYKNGDKRTENKQVANNLPTLAGFASKIGVHRDTLNEWTREHPEFSDSLKKAKELQEHILISNGLQGLYQGAFAIFTAKNILNWRDKQETEVHGGVNEDGTRRPFELFVNVGGGFIPASLTLPTSPAGSVGNTTAPESATVQGVGVASQGSEDIHSDNGDSQAGTP